tara:strand:- start:488 stop:856 length:369 start_codon:yes stop_codon:yes gene_type:complete
LVKKINNYKMKIYHNPRCRKSRETLFIINKKKIDVNIVEYLKYPPTKKEIKDIIDMLNIPALDLVRKEEKLFKKDYKGVKLSTNEWIDVLHKNPILIQRPIVIKDSMAIIGRPPINVLDLLK